MDIDKNVPIPSAPMTRMERLRKMEVADSFIASEEASRSSLKNSICLLRKDPKHKAKQFLIRPDPRQPSRLRVWRTA